MWEDNETEEGDDDEDEEDEGLAGQLLSDLIASNKYGTSISPLHHLFMFLVFSSTSLMFIYHVQYIAILSGHWFSSLFLISWYLLVSQMTIIMRMMRRMIQTL